MGSGSHRRGWRRHADTRDDPSRREGDGTVKTRVDREGRLGNVAVRSEAVGFLSSCVQGLWDARRFRSGAPSSAGAWERDDPQGSWPGHSCSAGCMLATGTFVGAAAASGSRGSSWPAQSVFGGPGWRQVRSPVSRQGGRELNKWVSADG